MTKGPPRARSYWRHKVFLAGAPDAAASFSTPLSSAGFPQSVAKGETAFNHRVIESQVDAEMLEPDEAFEAVLLAPNPPGQPHQLVIVLEKEVSQIRGILGRPRHHCRSHPGQV